jgi:hypothetical protein
LASREHLVRAQGLLKVTPPGRTCQGFTPQGRAYVQPIGDRRSPER